MHPTRVRTYALPPLLWSLLCATAPAQLPTKPVLDLAAARAIAAAAHAAADARGANVVIAIVDDGGHLLLLERRDHTQVASPPVAEAKARTAAIFRRPTREFEQQIANGRLATLVLPGAAPLQGGVPIVVAEQVIGAIGVSGNSPAEDEQIALVGAAVAQGLAVGHRAHAIAATPVATTIVRHDARLDAIVPFDAQLERIATGFVFTEGPLWRDGALLCSDPNENRIWQWSPTTGLTLFLDRSGYQGADIADYRQPGSNGLASDRDGNLLVCEHGNRCVSLRSRDGTRRVLCDRYQGRRLNSPNDVICGRDGAVYFTDPAFGLPQLTADPRKELPFQGVFRWSGGKLELITDELSGPNGLALSPDERVLYVGNWDTARKVVMAYPRRDDGSFGAGTVFLDLTAVAGPTAIDGIEVDAAGNLFVCGPGGVWIIAADGTVLGRIADRPEEPHNLAFGEDGRTLFLAAQTGLYRLRLTPLPMTAAK